MPAAPPLTLRALNRATLARQHLLARTTDGPLAVVEQLLGLQSQLPGPPYTGLWTRIEGFAFADLAALIEAREVVRIGLMRGTIHAVSARDAAGLWPWVSTVHAGSFDVTRRVSLEADGVDVDAAVARTLELLAEAPRTPKALAEALAEQWPNASSSHLGSIARHLLPVVQVPPRGVWGRSATATYALLEDWAQVQLAVFDAADVARRYLAAFGPATAADFQQWCGLKGLKPAFEALGDELVPFTGPTGKTLYDLADAPRPDGDEPAPVRLLPEWDNVLLSHADRTRLVDEDRRKAIMSVNGINDATVLVDGRVAASWKAVAAKGKTPAAFTVAPFERLTKPARGAIEHEAEALLTAMGKGYAGAEVIFEAEGAGWNASWKAAKR